MIEKIGHYRVVSLLDSGGMGVIYKAEDTRLKRFVALKSLPESWSGDPESLERFRREAITVSSLNHPNICTIFDILAHEGRPFMVMELLRGKTLTQHISGRPLKTPELLRLAIQTADALAAAHSRNIIHRDLKPDNLFVTEWGHIKILDFGLAKLVVEEPSSVETMGPTDIDRLTNSTAVMGTAAYMSPEQASAEPLDARSDLFSFGAVLYEMATGKKPFRGKTSALLFDQILNKSPVPVRERNSDVPPGLAETIEKSLEKDPSLRHQSASEMLADMRRLRRQFNSATYKPTSVGSGATRRPWLWTALAVFSMLLVVTLMAPVLWMDWSSAPSPAPPAEESVSLSVVPFEAEDELSLAAVLMAEGLSRQLAETDTLRLVPWVLDRQGLNHPSVDHLLRGNLEGTFEELVVGVSLLVGPQESAVWTREYLTSFDHLAQTQREISGDLLLWLDLEAQHQESIPADKRAETFYLKGRDQLAKQTRQDIEKGLLYFEQAIEADPAYVPAYRGLADSHALLRKYLPPPRGAVRRSRTPPAVRTQSAALPNRGNLVWSGRIGKRAKVVAIGPDYDGGTNYGDIEGAFPGVPFRVSISDPEVSIMVEPAPENDYRRLVLRIERKGKRQIQINWEALG